MEENGERDKLHEVSAPTPLVCPILGCYMSDPVVCVDGHSYERSAIERWLRRKGGPTSPCTGLALPSSIVVPNHALRATAECFASGVLTELVQEKDLERSRIANNAATEVKPELRVAKRLASARGSAADEHRDEQVRRAALALG